VELPKFAEDLSRDGSNAVAGLTGAIRGQRTTDVPRPFLLRQLGIALLPALAAVLLMGSIYLGVTAPEEVVAEGVVAMGFAAEDAQVPADAGGLQEPEVAGGLQEPEVAGGLQEPEVAGGLQEPEVAGGLQEPPGAVSEAAPAETASVAAPAAGAAPDKAPRTRVPAPLWFWIVLGLCLASVAVFYLIFDFARFEVFKMLLTSFFPLALLILGVLGSIIAGLATPTEAAAMGSFGGLLLAVAYGQFNMRMLKESVFLTARTSAMVCWLFVGSGIFAAGFALLGGQEIVNAWFTSLDLSPLGFMVLAQVIIFLLGWPLEWTEIIIIFMPIFLPLITHFNVDPLFFGLIVALNLQTAFLSPPVAMAAFYLKGVAPAHVTLNQIFLGMMPFMVLQILAIFLLYMFPQIGLWLPSLVYGAH
jgi:TRAP-type mannitol/chloroaromatic compound transport system permease large subunit